MERDVTAGGNNILVDTEQSGLYLLDDSGAELGQCIEQTPRVNANVNFLADAHVADYEMSFETYLQLREMNFPETEKEKLFTKMFSG